MGCPFSEMLMYEGSGDFISVLNYLVNHRGISTSVMPNGDYEQKLIFAKEYDDQINEIIDRMSMARKYVLDHGYYPPDWKEILKIYDRLKQEEKQQTKIEEKPVQPTPDTPTKPTNRSKPLCH